MAAMAAGVWQRYRAISRSERRWTIAAAAMLPVVSMALRIRPRATLRLAEGRATAPRARISDAPTLARQIAHAVDRAARRGPARSTCLARSVTLLWMLRGRGIPAVLRLGARRDHGSFAAHAWVELDGIVLNDRADIHADYPPLRHA